MGALRGHRGERGGARRGDGHGCGQTSEGLQASVGTGTGP